MKQPCTRREAHAIHLELQPSGYRDSFEFVTRRAGGDQHGGAGRPAGREESQRGGLDDLRTADDE